MTGRDYECYYLLHKQHLIPIFTNAEVYRHLFSETDYNYFLHIPYAVYQINVRSLFDPEVINIIYYLLAKKRTVLLGTGARGNSDKRTPHMRKYTDMLMNNGDDISLYRNLILSSYAFHKKFEQKQKS